MLRYAQNIICLDQALYRNGPYIWDICKMNIDYVMHKLFEEKVQKGGAQDGGDPRDPKVFSRNLSLTLLMTFCFYP